MTSCILHYSCVGISSATTLATHTYIYHVFMSISLSIALPAPVVSISPASGSPTAGQTYSLTCSVQVVPHLVVEPSIEWTRQDGTVLNASSGYSLLLLFNPLQTSDSNYYTCLASVEVTDVISVSGENSKHILLTSEMIILFCYMLLHVVLLHRSNSYFYSSVI